MENDNRNQHMSMFLQTKEKNMHDYFENSILEGKISFQTSNIPFDWTYASMHLASQQLLLQITQDTPDRIQNLVDVGSQFSFVSFAAAFFNVTYVEPRVESQRIYQSGLCNITKCAGEAQKMPFESNTFDCVTSLHAIEHFGLGRYGDTLDYHGDQRGIKEFARVICKNGHALLAVPAAKKSKIDFNGQRKYNPVDFDQIATDSGLTKVFSALAYPPFSFSDGSICSINVIDALNRFPEHFTPPVYIGLYKKIGE